MNSMNSHADHSFEGESCLVSIVLVSDRTEVTLEPESLKNTKE